MYLKFDLSVYELSCMRCCLPSNRLDSVNYHDLLSFQVYKELYAHAQNIGIQKFMKGITVIMLEKIHAIKYSYSRILTRSIAKSKKRTFFSSLQSLERMPVPQKRLPACSIKGFSAATAQVMLNVFVV